MPVWKKYIDTDICSGDGLHRNTRKQKLKSFIFGSGPPMAHRQKLFLTLDGFFW